jgi:NAD(P)-dependent dehydrogenase (short-subunit alcohol dehydrogenase family)
VFDLSGKVALVTGAGQGVGRGVALALAGQGATVAVNDLDPERAESTVVAIAAAGGAAFAVTFDVSDAEAVEAGIGLVTDRAGPVDVLVNNAGKGGQHGIGLAQFRQSGPRQWDGPLAVDLRGVMHCTRAVINPMCDRGWGRVVSIASDAGTTGVGVAKGIGVSAYAAAKGAVVSLMRHVAVETAAFGVTANAVALGLMEAPAGGSRSALGEGIPVGRLGTPADVGALCVYLASPEASWMTGQTIHLGGGQVTT